MSWTPIIGKHFTPAEFDAYVRGLSFAAWKPHFVVVHNTGTPNLAQRPSGFTDQHMKNLESFYRDQQKWSAGPHAFIDQNGIWAFTPLTVPGVHSPSWNGVSWGIETLGDYDTDQFDDPIEENLVACLTTLHDVMHLDPVGLRFHHEDPRTTHRNCPGANMNKPALIAEITTRLAALAPPPTPTA